MSVREILIEQMGSRFYKDFAANNALKVIELDGVADLYLLATDNTLPLAKVQKQQIIFRSAYTLEYIYFNYPDLFTPFKERFLTDFVLCQDPSAKRHFAKIMTDVLKFHTLDTEQIEPIAEVVVDWISDPKVKVAVKVWSMAILKILRPELAWVDEIWVDLEEMMTHNLTPAISVRIKRGW